jgi:hypothetical protein
MLREIKNGSKVDIPSRKADGTTPTAALSLDPDYLRMLVLKVRAFMGKEDTEVPDDGSNPTDDEMPSSAFQEDDDDLSREEVMEEIRGLDPRHVQWSGFPDKSTSRRSAWRLAAQRVIFTRTRVEEIGIGAEIWRHCSSSDDSSHQSRQATS